MIRKDLLGRRLSNRDPSDEKPLIKRPRVRELQAEGTVDEKAISQEPAMHVKDEKISVIEGQRGR